MKLPCRILGLIAAAAAAPVIVGCASDVPEPSPNKTDQTIETQQPARAEAEAEAEARKAEAAAPSPSSADPAEVATSGDSSTASPPEGEPPITPADDEIDAPAFGEDMPLDIGRGPMMPYGAGPTAPRGGPGTLGQDPCPACGMG